MHPHKRWILRVVTALAGLFLLQLFLFRWAPVRDLCLESALYDLGCWMQEPARVVVLGSSHAKYGVVPSVIASKNELEAEEVVNLSANDGTAVQLLATYRKNRDLLNKADVVYYTLEPRLFSEIEHLHKPYEKLFLSFKQWEYLAAQNNLANNYFLPAALFIDALGWKCTSNGANQGYDPLTPHAFTQAPFADAQVTFGDPAVFDWSELELQSLEQLIQAVRKDGATFIFLLTPLAMSPSEYPADFRAKDREIANILQTRLGPVPVVGSYFAEDYALTDKDFHDVSHLADSGARQFTAQCFADLQSHLRMSPTPVQPLYSYREDR